MGKFTYHDKSDYSWWQRGKNKNDLKRELDSYENDEESDD